MNSAPMLQKPGLGAVVDLQHPLARGLAAAWLFNEGAGGSVREASGLTPLGTFTGAIGWSRDDQGQPALGLVNAGTNNVQTASCPAFIIRDAITITCRVRSASVPAAARYWLIKSSQWVMFYNTNSRLHTTLFASSTSYSAISANNAVVTTDWNTCSLVYDRTWATRKARLYVNGIQLAYSAQPAMADAVLDSNTNSLRFGSSGAGGTLDGDFAFCYIHSRALSEDELTALTTSPYEMFEGGTEWLTQ